MHRPVDCAQDDGRGAPGGTGAERGQSRPVPTGPLTGWAFTGQLRRSQRIILQDEAVREALVAREPVHVVAPPGSGKTLLGLLLAMEVGERCLVLAPTATIRHQWATTATGLAPGGADTSAGRVVSEDPEELGDLTALTYQMLSVVDHHDPFDDLAIEQWVEDLVAGGRTDTDARTWIDELSSTNRRAYRRGIRRRSRNIRRDLVREDPRRIERVLHPNALALVDRLVEHGVRTIVLDECHHLLDHWALVVTYLLTRLQEHGIVPQLVGLTATLPSTEDENEYDNYAGLLGDVDYELPTPAVVKEGNLAPYRSFTWFVTPSEVELEFLRTHDEHLDDLFRDTLAAPDGIEFLTDMLQPGEGQSRRRRDVERRIGAAFKDDAAMAEAAARTLRWVCPSHRLIRFLGEEIRELPTTDQRIRVLARYALDRILPDSSRAPQWRRIRSVLADLGYTLTDRGIRRGRNPVESMLATSEAKDHAVADILAVERAADPGRIRAVVVHDYAVHGQTRGKQDVRAGALRCFATVVDEPTLVDMRPVLVTATHLRIAARDERVLLPALAGELGLEELTTEPVSGATEVVSVPTPGIGSARIIAAVSRLMTEDITRLIVGTRGLLGEGWDCPAANTLIDLTSVTTASSTQQLRGRTLRLDPDWKQKVAHNWSVTCLLGREIDLDGSADVNRLFRKLDTMWGISLDDGVAVIKGASHTLTRPQLGDLNRVLDKRSGYDAQTLNKSTLLAFPSRERTRAMWRIGEPYLGAIEETTLVDRPRSIRPFASGPTYDLLLAALGIGVSYAALRIFVPAIVNGLRYEAYSLVLAVIGMAILIVAIWPLCKRIWKAAKQAALPADAYRGAMLAVTTGLESRGEVRRYGPGDIVVTPIPAGQRRADRYVVSVTGGGRQERALCMDTFAEVFTPVGSPRFLLEVAVGPLRWSTWPAWLCSRLAILLGHRSRYFAVPRIIARRRADAHAFADRWQQEVGPCRLHEIDSVDDLALLTRARRRTVDRDARAARRHVWS